MRRPGPGRYGAPMPITRGIKELCAEADRHITTLTVEEAHARMGDPNVVLVDIRDPRELDRDGMLPDAFSATRGMLEFWVDPESPYYKPIFGDESKQFVLYCAGGLRSALATYTLVQMGMTNVSHIGGGFAAWKKAGLPVVENPKKHKD